MSAPLITASASILVAVLVFILNQRAQVREERRHARLVRVNSQLKDLYGPLHALVDVNERIWRALRASTAAPGSTGRTVESKMERERWRDNAHLPINRQMRDLIVNHADLLVETEIPEPIREFCAHAVAMEIVLAAKADQAEATTLVRHPGSPYIACVRDAFIGLKQEQRLLLRTLDGPQDRGKRRGDGTEIGLLSQLYDFEGDVNEGILELVFSEKSKSGVSVEVLASRGYPGIATMGF